MWIHWGRVSTYSEMCCRVPKTGWIHFVHASLWYQIPEAAISGVRQEISYFKVADNYSTKSSNRKAYKRFGTFCIGNSSVTRFQNKTQTALLNSRQTPVTLAHLSVFWMTQPLSNKDCHNTKGPAIDGVQSVSFSQQHCVLMTSLSAFPGVTSVDKMEKGSPCLVSDITPEHSSTALVHAYHIFTWQRPGHSTYWSSAKKNFILEFNFKTKLER